MATTTHDVMYEVAQISGYIQQKSLMIGVLHGGLTYAINYMMNILQELLEVM